MKRIKEYINEHPKLKRIVKILGVVAIVFSFLFNALIIGSLIINANKSNDSKVLAYGDYNVTEKKAIENQYNVYYSFTDFLSIDFIEGTYTILTDPAMTNIGLTGKSYEDFLNGTRITINDPLMYYATLDSSGEHITTDTSNIIYYVLNIQKDNSVSYPKWSFSFTCRVGYARYYTEFIYARYSSYGNNGELYYSNWSGTCVLNKSTDNGVTWTYNHFTEEAYKEYFLFTKNAMFNWMSTGNPRYNDYFNEGYEGGYETGYANGYNEGEDYGYDQGYYDGLQAGEQGESTMFTLISSAFSSIAAILDIQVLPNLSLGLLIFTPLIVTIIIVIVKMVKG